MYVLTNLAFLFYADAHHSVSEALSHLGTQVLTQQILFWYISYASFDRSFFFNIEYKQINESMLSERESTLYLQAQPDLDSYGQKKNK